jgi:predicted lipase
LALAIDQSKKSSTLHLLNERYPKAGNDQFWQLNYQIIIFYNNVELATTINKLIKECMSTSITDALADLTLQNCLLELFKHKLQRQ